MKKGSFIDIKGNKYGKLTAIEHVIKDNKSMWLCKCECGNFNYVFVTDLKNNKSKSCGKCPKNKFVIKDNYIEGYTSKGDIFYFDLEDLDKIKQHNWCKNKKGYIIARGLTMHRYIMSFYNNIKEKEVDHINTHIKYDNRKSNLRVCEHQKNMYNQKLRSDNSSGYTGVYWYKKEMKWAAQIKNIRIGLYSTIEEAIENRFKAELEYFGEFRYKGNDSKILNILEKIKKVSQ